MTTMWDVEPESDPEVAGSAQRIVEHVADQVRPGSIILLHVMYPGRAASLRAVEGIIQRLRGEGYRFVTVSELLEAEEPGTPASPASRPDSGTPIPASVTLRTAGRVALGMQVSAMSGYSVGGALHAYAIAWTSRARI